LLTCPVFSSRTPRSKLGLHVHDMLNRTKQLRRE
jgi:hypothetical protein